VVDPDCDLHEADERDEPLRRPARVHVRERERRPQLSPRRKFWVQFRQHECDHKGDIWTSEGNLGPERWSLDQEGEAWFPGVKLGSQGWSLVPRGEAWSPGVNVDPRGELGPEEVMLDPQGWTKTPGVKLAFRDELWHLGWTWTLGVNLDPKRWCLILRGKLRPREWSWPLGVNFDTWGKFSPFCIIPFLACSTL
jgi:hypothetical protein